MQDVESEGGQEVVFDPHEDLTEAMTNAALRLIRDEWSFIKIHLQILWQGGRQHQQRVQYWRHGYC